MQEPNDCRRRAWQLLQQAAATADARAARRLIHLAADWHELALTLENADALRNLSPQCKPEVLAPGSGASKPIAAAPTGTTGPAFG